MRAGVRQTDIVKTASGAPEGEDEARRREERDHDHKSTSVWPPVPVGRRRVVGEHRRGRPPGQNGLLSRAPSIAAMRGRPRDIFIHTAACTGCAAYCTKCLFASPDVRITKTARSQIIRDWT